MSPKTFPLGLTYNDVLLVPQFSRIKSRSLVDTSSKLTKRINLAIPFVSSNVDTVTESEMAIAMAKLGGIGIIHRFMTIDKEVAEVDRVKRSEGFVMNKPFTVGPKQTLEEVKILLKKFRVKSAVVVDEHNQVLGILSQRDMWFSENDRSLVKDKMTPASRLITATKNVTFEQAKDLFRKHKIEKLPILNKDKTLAGLITSRTLLSETLYPQATKDQKGRLRVGAAVGVVDDYLERAQALVKAGVDAIVMDIAHIHSVQGLAAVKQIRKVCHNTELIAGNIATAAAAKDLIKLDVDAVKVGIGPGGICITRMVAGAGVPQLSAIFDCARACHQAKVPLIADGGTNYPADMTKALAAGASTVMLTGWLAGSEESPGAVILRNGQRYKAHRGAASFSAVASRITSGIKGQVRKELKEQEVNSELESIVPEGVETFIPYKGAVKEVIYQLTGALRSGMSYCNAAKVTDLWKNAEFIQITPSGFHESKQHNVEEI